LREIAFECGSGSVVVPEPDDAALEGGGDRRRAVAYAQFPEDVEEVCLDGSFADPEPMSNLTVAEALGNQSEHLNFPPTQSTVCQRLASQQPAGDRRRE
jgi:hypothetical protein